MDEFTYLLWIVHSSRLQDNVRGGGAAARGSAPRCVAGGRVRRDARVCQKTRIGPGIWPEPVELCLLRSLFIFFIRFFVILLWRHPRRID